MTSRQAGKGKERQAGRQADTGRLNRQAGRQAGKGADRQA